MTEEKTTTVEMTAEELKELQELRALKAQKAAEEQKKADRQTYEQMVDEQVRNTVATAHSCSDVMRDCKTAIYDGFKTLLDMKSDLYGVKDGQRTHTFTSSDGKARVTLGFRSIDGYRDTAEAGVQMVKDALAELGTDDKSKALVKMVLSLLSRDSFGNLNAQRILQLEKVAKENGNERMMEGVQVIKDAYQPQITKEFIKVETRGELNQWENIPLSMTDVNRRQKGGDYDSEAD